MAIDKKKLAAFAGHKTKNAAASDPQEVHDHAVAIAAAGSKPFKQGDLSDHVVQRAYAKAHTLMAERYPAEAEKHHKAAAMYHRDADELESEATESRKYAGHAAGSMHFGEVPVRPAPERKRTAKYKPGEQEEMHAAIKRSRDKIGPIQTSPKGAHYYVSKSGEKAYIK